MGIRNSEIWLFDDMSKIQDNRLNRTRRVDNTPLKITLHKKIYNIYLGRKYFHSFIPSLYSKALRCRIWRTLTSIWALLSLNLTAVVMKLIWCRHQRTWQSLWEVSNIIKINHVVWITPPISEIIWVKNVRAIVVCGFLMKWLKKYILEIWKKIMGAVWKLPAK